MDTFDILLDKVLYMAVDDKEVNENIIRRVDAEIQKNGADRNRKQKY